jgi:hypothetical protein
MPNDTNVSELFWAASGAEPLPAAEPAAKSSCCGPKPAATEKVEGATPVVQLAGAPKASSCCGPKTADAPAEAPKAKSSCCG